MNEYSRLLVQNLKALNSKERDHLMRFAYLGANEDYAGESVCWLSPAMEKALLAPGNGLGLTSGARCVFAGMDYHLDWLYVALKATCEEISLDTTTFDGQMADHVHLPDDAGDPSLWSVSGSQEDLDLLVVFSDADSTSVLFVEAKGVAAFNKPQLGRKLVRLNRIWQSSGAQKRDADLHCQLVLICPNKPAFESCIQFARSFESTRRAAYSNVLKALNDLKQRDKRICDEPKFLKLNGFPLRPLKITRERDEGSSEFVRWKVESRR